MKIKKRYVTMTLVCLLTMGILLLSGNVVLTLAGTQQTQPWEAYTIVAAGNDKESQNPSAPGVQPPAPNTPSSDKEMQNPNAPILQPSEPSTPAPGAPTPGKKDKEYETQC
jgi:hypothetical protein